MGDPVTSLSRKTELKTRWGAVRKDFLKPEVYRGFQYADERIKGVLELDHTCADGCLKCRERRMSNGRSLTAPYLDIDTIGMVADPQSPSGPLGGVVPLPEQHPDAGGEEDFADYDFGLSDIDILNLLEGLATKRVAVVGAGAGTGKSTFLPYRLLLPPTEATLRLADRGPIVVTEPRRAAAINTATFVATKLHHSAVGAGYDVGYRVQDEPAYDASCRLLYVTDGSLINWLRDGSFKRFSTIIVDEAHERSKNIDIILGLLREALTQYPDLRLIVSSATIDTDFFIEYFGGSEAVFILKAPAYRRWGFGSPLWPIEEIGLAPWKNKKGPNGEDLQAITAQLAGLRVVDKPIDPGNWRREMPTLVAKQVLRLLEGTKSGDILAFLPGQKAIDKAVTLIRKGTTDPVDVYPLLRTSPEEVQRAALDKKADSSRRRVIVATNIAETSLTIEGMTYVVDSGLINQSRWNISTATKTVPSVVHSREGVRQRWGRVGRKMPGWIFPLYTRKQFDDRTLFPLHTPPESTRDDLEQFLLTAKAAGIDAPRSLTWPAAFERKESEDSHTNEALRVAFQKEMKRADRALKVRGALDREGDMTPLGSELRAFGGSMAHAIALVLGDRMACAIEVATALLLLNRPRLIGTLLLWNKGWDIARRNEVRRLHEGLWAGCLDDLDLALKVYAAWEASNRPEAWAEEHAVSHTDLIQIKGLRDELLESLFPGRSKSFELRPLYTELAPRVRAVLSRALADQIYVRELDGWHAFIAGGDSLKWKIDPLACYNGGAQVIAMQREFTENGILLSNLVLASEWAARSGDSWIALALEATARLQGVRGPGLREHLALLDEWRIGEQYQCAVEPETEGSRLRALRPIVEGAEAVETKATTEEKPGNGEDEEAEDDNGDGDDEETLEVEQEERPDVVEEEDDVIEEILQTLEENLVSKSDLIAIAPPGVLDVAQLEQFIDPSELEAPELYPELHAGLYSELHEEAPELPEPDSAVLALPLPDTSVPITMPRALTIDGAELPEGEVNVRVLGYRGYGDARTLIVAPYGGDLTDALANSEGEVPQGHGTEVTVKAIEMVTRWGRPFLVALEEQSGTEVVIEPAELVLDSRMAGIFPIPSGARFRATLLKKQSKNQRTLVARRRRQLAEHLVSIPLSDEWTPPLYAAQILSRDLEGGYVYIALEHGDEATGLIHPFIVERRALQRAGIKIEPGMRLGVQLDLPLSKEGERLARVETRRVPPGLEELLGDKLVKINKRKVLRWGALMPLELRNKLLALPSMPHWHNIVWDLWLQSTRVEVVSVQAATDIMLEKRFPLSHNYAATMDELGPNGGIYVTLEGGQRALARNSDIGPGGIRDPRPIFEQGHPVDVHILDISGGDRGKPFISVAIPAPPSPQEISRKRLPLKSSVAATVTIVNDKYGIFVQLEGGQPALARRGRIGPEGVIFPSRYFRPGRRLTVEIDEIGETSTGEAMIYVAIPSAKVPSRVDQVRERFPAGSVVAAEVVGVDERGVFVALEGGLQAWVQKSDIGPEGMMAPQLYYRKNQSVNIRILEITDDDLSGVQITAAIPDGPSRLQQARDRFREGSTMAGKVKEIRDDVGVSVALSADQDAMVMSRAIGPEGVINASTYFEVGQRVEVVIRSVQQDDAGAVTIESLIPAPFVPPRFEQLRNLFPVGTLTWGSIKTIRDDLGLFVRVDAAQATMVPDVFVHWSKIGSEGVIDLGEYFSPEQRVEVRIREVTRDDNGRIRMLASIPHPSVSVPSMLQQLLDLYPVGKAVTCKVENVRDGLGVFVKLRGNVNAFVHMSKIGPGGVDTPSQYFTKDQWVEIRIIKEAYLDKEGKIRIQASIPSLR